MLVDASQVEAQPSSLVLNLFDDVWLNAVETKTTVLQSGSLSWVGEVPGSSPSIVSLVLAPNGSLSGAVSHDGDLYELRPVGDGVHTVLELDPNADEPGDDGAGDTGAPVSGAGAPNDDITEIDLLIAYTPMALESFGDLPALRSAYESRVEMLNAVLEDSLASPRLRIIDFYALDDPEVTQITFANITNRSDGRLDDLPVVRDIFSADLVNIVLTKSPFVGQGQLSISAPDAGISYQKALANPLTFLHEIGHTFGANHHRGDPFFPPGDLSPELFNFGHVFSVPATGKIFNTVVAGTSASGQRIPFFSNPNVLFDGQPTGIAAPDPEAAHNVRTINEGAQTVANRRLADPIKPGDVVTMLSVPFGRPPVEFFRHRDGKPPELVAAFDNGEVVIDFTVANRNNLLLLTATGETVCDPSGDLPCPSTVTGKLWLLDVESGSNTLLTEGGALTFTDLALVTLFPLLWAGDAVRLPNLRAVLRFGDSIVFFNPSNAEQTVVAEIGGLRSVFPDVDGTVLATSRASACVFRVTLEDGATETVACASDPGSLLSDPGPVVIHPSGTIFVGDTDRRIVSIDPETGAQSEFTDLGISTNSAWSAMHIDWRGDILVSEGNAGAVVFSPATGSELVLDATTGSNDWMQSARFHSPRLPDCMDGRDNDGDLLADFPADPECASFRDFSEVSPFGGGAGSGGSGCGLGGGSVAGALLISAVRSRRFRPRR